MITIIIGVIIMAWYQGSSNGNFEDWSDYILRYYNRSSNKFDMNVRLEKSGMKPRVLFQQLKGWDI